MTLQNVDDIYPLSPMQQLMLLHSLTSPDSETLINRICYEIRGDLDVAAFGKAWQSVVARHPALRTCFLWEGLERPVQVVRRVANLEIEAVEPLAPDARIEDPPFDLRRAPLMRCRLAREEPNLYRFEWRVHHLVVDRWSLETVMTDLGICYAAHLRATEPDLPPVSEFRDYIAWLGRQDRDAVERFWTAELEGFSVPTRLAPDAARDARAGRSRSTRRLTEARTRGLIERAASWGSTPASVVLIGVGVALAMRTGHTDVICDLTVSGRPPDLDSGEAAVGSFVNNVPLRIRLDRGESIAQVARELQRSNTTRYPYEHASPAEISDWAGSASHGHLTDLLVLLNLAPSRDPVLPGVEMTPISATLDAAYPLLLSIELREGELCLDLVHDTGHDVVELLDELVAALERLEQAEPDARLGAVFPGDGRSQPGRLDSTALPSAPTPAGTHSPFEGVLPTIREILGISEIGPDDDFFELGGTSLQAARLFSRLERESGRTLPLSMVLSARTPRALSAALGRPIELAGPVVPFRATGEAAPLVVVPGIGGNVVSLTPLADAVGSRHPFFGLQSRGLSGESEPLTSIEEIAEDFVRHVLETTGSDIHLLGLCWGAAVVFEMARILERGGSAPRSIALMDPAVLLRNQRSATDASNLGFVTDRLRLYRSQFREESLAGKARWVTQKLARAASVVKDRGLSTDSRLEIRFSRVRRANELAVSKYRPQITGCLARIFLTSDRDVHDGADPRLEWCDLVQSRPEVVWVPGVDSGDAIHAGNVAGFAEPLLEWLREAEER